jgi:branched-chain amino acid transport system ATP-binding protein
MLEVERLGVRYGQIQAVRDLSLRVEKGEIVALLGANGAGKTTTLAAAMGLVAPSGGRVVFEGREITGLAPEAIVKRGMTLTPEGRRVFARLTVEDNLRLGAGGRLSRADYTAERDRALTLFPILRERLHAPAGTLSGGEQQQLAFARSLMSRPRLLLLDEPSLGLAPGVVGLVFATISTMRADGVTILLVEQNVHRALEIADRAYVLGTGRVVLQGDAATLRASSGVERAYLGIGSD